MSVVHDAGTRRLTKGKEVGARRLTKGKEVNLSISALRLIVIARDILTKHMSFWRVYMYTHIYVCVYIYIYTCMCIEESGFFPT